MLAAAARRQASAIASNSTRLSLTGGEVGWMIKTSLRRTGCSRRTRISPSGNRSIAQAPVCVSICSATAAAKLGFAVPARIVNSLPTPTSGALQARSAHAARRLLHPLLGHGGGPQIPYLGRQYMLNVLNL